MTDAAAPPAVRRLSATTAVAGGLVVLLGYDHTLYRTLTLATVLGLPLLPVWWTTAGRFRGGRPLLVVGGVALVSGPVLTELALDDHSSSLALMMTTSFILLNILVGIAVVLWARTRMRTSAVAVLLGVGMVAALPMQGLMLTPEAWRFRYSLPLTVLLLALTWHFRRRWLDALVALGLAGATASAGGRSTFAMLLVAAAFAAWQASASRTVVGSRARILALGTVLLFAMYQLGQGLILDGYLGGSAQARTQMQIEQSGNVLLGARPEMGATIALVAHRPLGFGSGTVSSAEDVRIAMDGMAALGYDPRNGYVYNYMFGAGYEVHSVIGDLWAAFGVAGAVLALMAVGLAGRTTIGLVARRVAPALAVYLTVRLAWNILFGPILASSTLVAATVGLLLVLHVTDGEPGSGDRLDPERPAPG